MIRTLVPWATTVTGAAVMYLAAVAFHALALLQMQADGVGTDDRFRS